MGFKNVIEEISFELSKITLFNTFLDSAIAFMAIYFILAIFSFYPMVFSTIIALLYFIFILVFRAKESSILKVESKYTALKEKLRTAADNVNLSNSVIAELQEDIVKDIGRVEDAAFFDERKTYTKILAILALAFLIVFSAPVSFDIVKPNINFQDIRINLFEKQEKKAGAGVNPYSGEIYGARSIAKLGTEELKIEIKHVGFEVNLKSVQNIEEREFGESFPSEIYAESGEAFEEDIPKEEQEIVKNYFKAVAEGNN